jgi:TRAP-type C4-dicarboxylate transport system permease large subunit
METIDHNFLAELWNGVQQFFALINWLFIVVFMLSAWIANDTIDSTNTHTRWADFLKTVPKILRSLALGIVWIVVFAWGFRFTNRTEIMAMIFSLVLSSFLYQVGINKVFRWISSKLGLKFE